MTRQLLNATNLHALFRARAQASPDAVAYAEFCREGQGWRRISWRDAAATVDRWRAALAGEGLAPGDRVAMALRNGVDWLCFEQAALSLELVVVPLYPDDRAENAAYIVAHAGVRLLLVQDAGRWRRLAGALRPMADLRVRVLGKGDFDSGDDPRVRAVGEWLAAAPPYTAPLPAPAPDSLATIVYTSGTMGRPKGVMLSHRNILSNVAAGLAMFEIRQQDRFLSFLPLAHMLERSAGYYLPMAAGASIAFARSVPQLADDLKAIRPTVLIAVPRIFETIYGRIQQQLESAPTHRRALFRLAVEIGWHAFEHRQGRAGWHPRLLLRPLLAHLVGRRLLERFGGELRLAVSGGAALSPQVARLFLGLGLNLCQGYGLTEASPVVSFNLPTDNRPASIGVALPGLELVVGAEDELLVRGPNVMRGYWRDKAATARTVDAQGWLHTGDQVRLHGRHWYIVGRLKEIIVLSNGEKVPPVDLEGAITLDPLFDQALVVGEGRPFLAAVVVLNPGAWQRLAGELGIDPGENGLAEKRAVEQLLTRIGASLHAFPGYAKVRRVHATLEPWSAENGLLTPTLKLRRTRLAEHYAEEIEALYGERVIREGLTVRG